MKPLKYILEEKEYKFDPERDFRGRSIGMISASRGNLSPEENEKRSHELHNILKNRGHHVIPVNGVYIENFGSPNAKEVNERSFIVMHKQNGDDKGLIHNHLMELGERYQQDSILHKPFNSQTASLHGTNETGWPGKGKKEAVGSLKMERGEFYTKLDDGRAFSFKP
jgi:hypothetical protein